MNCTSLTSVTIGKGVANINDNAFLYCSNLTSITIPNSVTVIGGQAFSGCTSLTSVKFEGTINSENFGYSDRPIYNGLPSFLGDLRAKFYITDSVNGTPGTYTTTAPVNKDSVWTKQL